MTTHVIPPVNPDLDQARLFLAKTLPWPEPGEAGYVDIIWSFLPDDYQPKPGDKPGAGWRWTGSACETLEEAVRAVRYALSKKTTKNIYACMSTQRTCIQATSKRTGKPWRKASRSSENALKFKSLFIDLDWKGKDQDSYDNRSEAITALANFIKGTGLPKPSVLVSSGGGVHVYWTLDRTLTKAEWLPLAHALSEATIRFDLKCDRQCTIDAARVLRIPDTFNHKLAELRPVKLEIRKDFDFSVERIEKTLEQFKVALPTPRGSEEIFLDPALFGQLPAVFRGVPVTNDLAAGLEREDRTCNLDELAKECAFLNEAVTTGGKNFNNPEWNLTNLIATFTEGGCADAHRMGNQHSGYNRESTDEQYDRKLRERDEKGLGFPSCAAISHAGYSGCQSCPHFAKGRSALAALPRKVTAPPEPPSFADPYAHFVGPPFPISILPAVLADFVEAEHQAMGVDPAALAMGALTVVAGALHSESKIQVGDGWFERPILWTMLVGSPSTKKSPVTDKAVSPLDKIDAVRGTSWTLQLQQAKAAGAKGSALPPKPARCVVQDATPEKIAEILSRDPAGSLMVHDELAGWLGSFERYSSGASSRAQFLTCWNGGRFLKDRVGKGISDEHAEIRVDNLALGILGGIQPDRLADLRDLTGDGLLQRFLVVLMRPAERGNERYPVAAAEADYARLIQSVQSTCPLIYTFDSAAEGVCKRVLDRLYQLEQVDGFSSAVIGAIGKVKGYFARLALTLQVAHEHSVRVRGGVTTAGHQVSSQTAEAAEKLIFEFLLPHMFGLYDVVANRGQDRDTLRAIADFILASTKDRLRPCDFGIGVRRLRGEPSNKITEWAGRFIVMGWLCLEDEKAPTPKAWLVEPGLRAHFVARRQAAQAARAAAHAILKAGGSRR